MTVVVSTNNITFSSAGTAAAPAITPSTDTNTGLFFPAADTVAFSAGGSQIVSIDSTGITAPLLKDSQGGVLAPISSVMRNRIINGAMVIDQRNAGASVSVNGASVYTVDRFRAQDATDGAFTVQQVSDAPTGFINSAKITVTTADASLGATQFANFTQFIEGYNIADLGWGTANAKTVTLSFWVRSSLTGTFGGALINSAVNRSYPYTYTISSANTWEQKSITIAGDTSGTWLTTNGTGMAVHWGLGVGSTYSGTAGSWSGNLYLSATGATSVVGTNGATFYITGVQLEVGTQTTSFEYRQYQQELALCQRYYQKSYNIDVVPGTATDLGAVVTGVGSTIPTTGSIEGGFTFKVTMRTAPTLVGYDRIGNSGFCSRANVGIASTNSQNVGFGLTGSSATYVSSSGSANASTLILMYTASAEL